MTKALLVMLVCCATLLAGPIDVSYSVTGGAGNWTLDFSVANNLVGAPDHSMYFFGVELSATNITGIPIPYSTYGTWSNAAYGGSSTTYNNVWITGANTALPGSTTSGFQVTIPDLAAPTSVKWFAFTYGNDPYTGGGNFYNSPSNTNPGFEGIAGEGSGGAVPEPSTLAIFGSGLAGLIALRRRKTA